MLKYVILDVDGTLIDSVDWHAQSWKEAFLKFGKDVPFAEIRKQIGKGGDLLTKVFWSDEELEKIFEDMKEHRSQLFRKKYLPLIKPFSGVRPLCRQMLDEGLALAIASSSDKDDLQHLKKIAEIDDLLEEETSADDADRSKPYPDIFAAVMERLKINDPATAIAIGDTPYDAEAAGKIGLKTIGVRCGGWNAPQLTEAGCIAVYQGPAELWVRYPDTPLGKLRQRT